MIGVLLLFTACEKEESKPNDAFLLNSKMLKGFSFTKFKIIDYPNSSGKIPNFQILAQTGKIGDVLSPFMSNPNLDSRFVSDRPNIYNETHKTYL